MARTLVRLGVWLLSLVVSEALISTLDRKQRSSTALYSSRHRPQQQRRSSSFNSKSPRKQPPIQSKNTSTLATPSLRTQLDYSRLGHAVLRDWIDPRRLARLRPLLLEHAQRQELAAWQQKVQVASGNEQLTQACTTVAACQQQLRHLLGDTTALPFLQYFNTWRSIDQVRTLAEDLAPAASVLLNVESVRLYQDAIFWKRAGDGPTPWYVCNLLLAYSSLVPSLSLTLNSQYPPRHVDARMAPFDSPHLVTFWIPLHDVTATGLVFSSATHADYALPYWHPVINQDHPDSEWNQLKERYPDRLVDYMPMRLGDVTVHAGWTLHCADAAAEEDRLALAITLVDARAPVREDAMATPTKSSGYGDNEDAWSYQEWIHQVPKRCYRWNHPLVPILWPKKKKKKKN